MLVSHRPGCRFNDPGEVQATGKWSAQEHELFLKRKEEVILILIWLVSLQ